MVKEAVGKTVELKVQQQQKKLIYYKLPQFSELREVSDPYLRKEENQPSRRTSGARVSLLWLETWL